MQMLRIRVLFLVAAVAALQGTVLGAASTKTTTTRLVRKRSLTSSVGSGSEITSGNSTLSYDTVGNALLPQDDDAAPPPRVIIDPFVVELGPTNEVFTEAQVRFLLDTMETVVFDYITDANGNSRLLAESSGSAAAFGRLEYIKFGAARQVYNAAASSVALSVDTGVASFAQQPIPSAALVDSWVQTALSTNLVGQLQQVVSFAAIDHAKYTLQSGAAAPSAPTTASLPAAPAASPTSGAASGGSAKVGNDQRSSAEKDGLNIPLVAGTTAAAAACLLVLLAVVSRRRRHERSDSVEILPPKKKSSPPPPSRSASAAAAAVVKTNRSSSPKSERKFLPPSLASAAVDARLDDGRSVADSESEWTVATEAGDTTTLKSVYPSLLTTQPTPPSMTTPHHASEAAIGLALSESFERDRQVAITKDMLTGQWSGRIHSNRLNGGGHNNQSESVLQPSHFSASQERRVRKAAAAAAAAASVPDRETSSISSREETSSNGSEPHRGTFWRSAAPSSVQVSPSQTSRRRIMAGSPPPPNVGMCEL
jgi:hypothetical protein